MRSKNLTTLWFALILVLYLGSIKRSTATVVPTPVEVWAWPLDGDFIILENAKHNTVLENTNFGVKNLDLVSGRNQERITCFNVGWHRTYHAGVDLYLRDGNTANAPVKAVADGTIEYVDGGNENVSIIIYHPYQNVWSVYWHINDPQFNPGDAVTAGQTIGYVFDQAYEGRFPEVHPFGVDDSHLHFEIRTFYDGGTLFPNSPDCNIGYIPGVGYTYPILPGTLGYLDPIEFLESRITLPDLEPQYYLPTVHYSGLPCQNGQSLITPYNNGGFEYSVTDPDPWFEVTTYFDPPDNSYYNFVQNNPYLAHSGNHVALLGAQLPRLNWIVDEEMPQSFRLPDNISSLEWIQYLWLQQTAGSPTDYGTEFGDQFVLALKDAETGHSLISDVIIDHTSQNYLNFVWLWVKITIPNADTLSNRLVSASYSSLTDGDVIASTMRVDDVSFITYCGGGVVQSEPPSEVLTVDVTVEPIE